MTNFLSRNLRLIRSFVRFSRHSPRNDNCSNVWVGEERRKSTMKRPSSPTFLKSFRRQKCSVCGCQEKFNVHVPDEIWEKAVPQNYRNRVVCLSCFDNFAREKDVDYSDSIRDLLFAGEKAAVRFEIKSSQDM